MTKRWAIHAESRMSQDFPESGNNWVKNKVEILCCIGKIELARTEIGKIGVLPHPKLSKFINICQISRNSKVKTTKSINSS